MTPLFQPGDSKICGQTCVAMAAGVTIEDAVKAVGHKERTKTLELALALRKLGVECDDRLRIRRNGDGYPPRCIVKVSSGGKRNWHWVLMWDGKVYDPASLEFSLWPWQKTAGYLEIKKNESS